MDTAKPSELGMNSHQRHRVEESISKLDADFRHIFATTSLANAPRRKQFLAKEVLYQEGNAIDKVFYIQRGMVKLLSYLPNGRARIVRLHAEGHWLGLEALAGQPYEHTAYAVDDVDVDILSLHSLHLLEQDNPRLYCQILKQGYKYLAQADHWIADLSTGGIKSRVARLIVFLAKLKFGQSANVVELLTVHEMAEMLGVTAESVSRVLAEFKRNEVLHRRHTGVAETYEINAQQLQIFARQ